jgi:dihydroflavonol-4-reductase
MRKRSISVTGATGFVGWHLTQACVASGWDVRAVVRPGNRKPVPDGAVVVEAPLAGAELSAACDGSDVLVHCAAVVRAPSERVFHDVNVGGTKAAVAAAKAAGARLVLISSLAAAGPSPPDAPRSEDDPPAPVNAYGRSKLAAEAVVREAAGLEWTIVRPAAVFGPRDRGFLPLFAMARRGLFLAPSRRPVSFTLVHVDDLVRAVQLAVDAPAAAGATFFVGHPQAQTVDDILSAIARSLARPYRPWHPPEFMLGAAARVGDAFWAMGVEPTIDSARLVELRSEGFVCAVDRARDLLGFAATISLGDGMDQAARWYREHGWIGR